MVCQYSPIYCCWPLPHLSSSFGWPLLTESPWTCLHKTMAFPPILSSPPPPLWGVLEGFTTLIRFINSMLRKEWEDVTLGMPFMTHLRTLRDGNKGDSKTHTINYSFHPLHLNSDMSVWSSRLRNTESKHLTLLPTQAFCDSRTQQHVPWG